MVLKTKITITYGSRFTQKAFNRPKQGNSSASDKSPGVCATKMY
jgi:hypothetical protein